jgi:hypothetical protein
MHAAGIKQNITFALKIAAGLEIAFSTWHAPVKLSLLLQFCRPTDKYRGGGYLSGKSRIKRLHR